MAKLASVSGSCGKTVYRIGPITITCAPNGAAWSVIAEHVNRARKELICTGERDHCEAIAQEKAELEISAYKASFLN
jgi:hypothetical protein